MSLREPWEYPSSPSPLIPACCSPRQAALGERPDPSAFITVPLPEPEHTDVSVAELLTFFRDPVRGFFRALDVTLPWDVDGVQDAMPVEVDALAEWGVGDRMLNDILRGMHPDDGRPRRMAARHVAAGTAGRPQSQGDPGSCDRTRACRTQVPDTCTSAAHDVDIELGDGRRLTGTVSGVYGDRVVFVTYSKLGGKHLLEAWIRLLALTAGVPGRPWSAVCIGRAKRGAAAVERHLVAPHRRVSRSEVLRGLVDLYDAGRREPLPLPVKTSYAWAEARLHDGDVERAAGFRWRTNKFPGEDQDQAYARVWGKRAPLRRLLGPPRPGEECPASEPAWARSRHGSGCRCCGPSRQAG